MKKSNKLIVVFLLLLLVFIVFRSWFRFAPLSAGDWSYNFSELVGRFSIFPSIWNWHFLGGMGGPIDFILALETYFLATAAVLSRYLGMPWVLIERIIWFWPFLALSLFSSFYLFKKIFPQNVFGVLSPFIFLFNTYTLMLVGGGQMGVAFAYALAPLVLACFINDIDTSGPVQPNIKYPMISGLALAVMVLFDVRVAYGTMVASGLYCLMHGLQVHRSMSLFKKESIVRILRSFVRIFVIPCLITLFLHFFWVLPLLVYHQNPFEQLGGAYSTSGAVKFFSFADFSHTFSFLHPNWPENIFGKVYFLRPEFLFIPILAFSSLLFISKIQVRYRKEIIFFVLLGLIGAFLAKGAHSPFGGIYIWLFENVPGFMMFRDPTKWYVLVALSYAVLIPFTLENLSLFLSNIVKDQKYRRGILLGIAVFFIGFWLVTIREAVTGQLSGTFTSHSVPSEYDKLEILLDKDKDYYRTYWVPSIQRFGYSTDIHPAIDSLTATKEASVSGVITWLKKSTSEKQLARWGIQYVIVPDDSLGEIFLTDRKYDPGKYNDTVKSLKQINWLKELSGWETVKIFETTYHYPKFWTENSTGDVGQDVRFAMINLTKYKVTIGNGSNGKTLVFSEKFDPYWTLHAGNAKIYAKATVDHLNSFEVQSNMNDVTIEYEPQRMVVLGLGISGVSAFIILTSLLLLSLHIPNRLKISQEVGSGN